MAGEHPHLGKSLGRELDSRFRGNDEAAGYTDFFNNHLKGGCHCERSEAISFTSPLSGLGKELSAWRQTGSENLLLKLPVELNSFRIFSSWNDE